jgi:hypothetical protein
MLGEVAGRKAAALGSSGRAERRSTGRTYPVPRDLRTRVVGRGAHARAIRRNRYGRYSARMAARISDIPLTSPLARGEKTRHSTGPISAEPRERFFISTRPPPYAGSANGRAERNMEYAIIDALASASMLAPPVLRAFEIPLPQPRPFNAGHHLGQGIAPRIAPIRDRIAPAHQPAV